MFRIVLINMPFARINAPSLALTQLRSRLLEGPMGDQLDIQLYYFNHDFRDYLGRELYTDIVGGHIHHLAGTGDWFFRQIAFPSAPDNTDEYLGRYFAQPTPENAAIKRGIFLKRRGLRRFMRSLIDKHDLVSAQIVGFTSMFSQNVACMAMAQLLKDAAPEIVTVMGGANCEYPMGRVIADNVPQIDFVFSGPALLTFPELVENCLSGQSHKNHAIDGVFSKNNRVSTPGGPISLQKSVGAVGKELDIDTPVSLDYDDFVASIDEHSAKWQDEIELVLYFETSRGCWWGQRAHCTFCGLNGASMGYRYMKPELALELIQGLVKRYYPRIKFYDSVDNILALEYFDSVVDKLDMPDDVHIFYEVKANMSASEVESLARARIMLIQPGIESLATSTLKLMRKGTSSFKNIQLLKYCSIYGVTPQWNLLVGFPGEGADVYRKYVADMPSLVHLPVPNGAYPVRFDRYSPYFMESEQYGLDLHPLDFYELTYPIPAEEIAKLAYYFTDRNFDADYLVDVVEWLGAMQAGTRAWAETHESGVAPVLHFLDADGRPGTIRDSRSGAIVEHEIGDTGRRVLDMLEKPLGVTTIAKAVGDREQAEQLIQSFMDKKLLFHEGTRYLSLVLPDMRSLNSARDGHLVADHQPAKVPQSVAAQAVDRPTISLSEFQLVTETWNQWQADYPDDQSLGELFSARAARQPDAIALVDTERELSYRELERQSNRVAHRLIELGVVAEERVGVCLERSFEFVIAVLGIIKAGAAYVPLDPSYPDERLQYMFEHSGCRRMLSEVRHRERLARVSREVLYVQDILAQSRQTADQRWHTPPKLTTTFGSSLAYVMYTSGSTGRPKGIMIEHRGVARISCNSGIAPIGPDDVMGHVSNVSFDVATWEIWGALLNGARLGIIDKDTILSLKFIDVIDTLGVTVMFMSAALCHSFVDQVPEAFLSVRHLLVGGEAPDPARMRQILKFGPPERLLNGYGPTEAVSFASFYEMSEVPEDATLVPIGRAVNNMRLYVLDESMQPAPIGVPGELYLGGDGLARGYHENARESARRFLPDPFVSRPGQRMYRTGDLARYRPDGYVEFLGRVDHQVKLRGFRVELGEIESVLREHPTIRDAVVMVHETPRTKKIVAFLSHASEQTPQESELRAHVAARLPDYMMPATFVVLEQLPIAPGGKCDRQKLRAMLPDGDTAASAIGPSRIVPVAQAS